MKKRDDDPTKWALKFEFAMRKAKMTSSQSLYMYVICVISFQTDIAVGSQH